jgi:hypothetical protein
MRRGEFRALALLALLALLAGACRAPAPPPREAAALAWDYACAITNDAKDRAAAQQEVALAYLAADQLTVAVEHAAAIADWRRGLVLAEAAATLAGRDERSGASNLLARAALVAAGAQDWQRDRIRRHMARAKALLGLDRELSAEVESYNNPQDYRGPARAYHAVSLARQGRPEQAREILEELAEATDYETALARVDAYRMLADRGAGAPDAVAAALEAAWAAAARVPGNRRWELQFDLLKQMAPVAPERARACADEACAALEAAPFPAHIRLPLLTRAAQCRARLGDREGLAHWAALAEAILRSRTELEPMEIAAGWTAVGEARAAGGDIEGAGAAYDQALDVTAGLVNPRPRCRAAVALCLSLERSGQATPARLQRLSARVPMRQGAAAKDSHGAAE